MNISIPCMIQKTSDVPIYVNGVIPYFTDYRDAYQFLYDLGYTFNKDEPKPMCVVLDINYDQAMQMFGEDLIPYSQLKDRSREPSSDLVTI